MRINLPQVLRAAFLATVFGLALTGCGPAPVVVQESYVFGTRVEVSVAGLPEPEAIAAANAVLAEFDRLHHALHAWRPSELTTLNAAIARGESARVGTELAGLLQRARALTIQSDKLFDPGIGRLIALWGFHSEEFTPRLPDAQALQAWLREAPSLADLEIRPVEGGAEVRSGKRSVAVDLGGYAKGYALDRAAVILRARGVANALINIGGNVMALGDKHGKPWRVGIRDPRGTGHLAALDLRDGEAIGTSGDYQRYFEINGQRYNHLLDPRSGGPSTGAQAVTLLVPAGEYAGADSDALSKPLFVVGAQGFAAMAARLGAAHVLRVDAGGELLMSQAMAARLSFSDARGKTAQIIP